MSDVIVTPGNTVVEGGNADTNIFPGTSPIPAGDLVCTDQITIFGAGSPADPLRAVGGGGISVVADEITVLGNGTTLEPLRAPGAGAISVTADGITITGDGKTATPLEIKAGFSPSRALYVSKAWPTGSNPLIYFTTISAALAQAATMNPLSSNKVLIAVFPGTYTENLVLVSNVSLCAATPSQGDVTTNGTITWTPGAGVNAPQTTTLEQVNFNSISQTSGNTFTFDSTGKTSNSAVFDSQEATFGTPTFTGRGTNVDTALIYLSNFFGTATFNNMTGSGQTVGLELFGARFRGTNFGGNTVARIAGGNFLLGTMALTGTANVTVAGITHVNTCTVASGCSLTIAGSNIVSTITVASGGAADVRGCNYGGNANLIGPGTINRTTWCQTTGTTGVGPNAITFNPPYPDATNLNVVAQQVSGIAGTTTITAKTGAGCTLGDTTGGNVFDLVVVHD